MQELTNPQSPEWLLNQVTLDAFEKQEQQNTSGTPLLSGTMFSNGRRNTDSIKLLGLLARNNMDSGTKEIAFKAFINALPDKMDEAEINSLLNSSERYDASSIQPLTERSFATTLYSQIKNKFVLVKSNGFYRFNGRHWELDENNKHILNFAYHVGDKMKAELDSIAPKLDEKVYKSLKSALLKLDKLSFVKNAIEILQSIPELEINFSDLNCKDNCLNFNNGTYDLKTDKLTEHQPEDFFTWAIDCDYDPNAECKLFDNFINEIIPENDKFKFVMRMFGSAFVAKGIEQKVFFLVGKGSNGKSVLVNVIDDIMGDLSSNVDASSWMLKANGHIPNDLARLVGKQATFTNETSQGSIIESGMFKKVAGGDALTVRFFNKEFFEFFPEFTPFITTNHMPVMDTSDFAMTRRIVIFKFDVTIPENKIDKKLKFKLPAEKSGIMNRLIQGIKDYQENGLMIPAQVQADIDKYVLKSNLIQNFFLECCQRQDEYQLNVNELFKVYKKYCVMIGTKSMSQPIFLESFENNTGLIMSENTKRKWFEGISIDTSCDAFRSGGIFNL